jgi:hypothetical protein
VISVDLLLCPQMMFLLRNPLKKTFLCVSIDDKPDDHLSFADYLTIVHEHWIPTEDDKQQLQEAFDILDPQNKSKLIVDDFVYLLKNCDWPDEEIELMLSHVSCADGYFMHDGNNYSFFSLRIHVCRFIFKDLKKILITPIETSNKKSAKAKKKGK